MGNELSVESKAKRKKYAKEYKLDAIGLVINQGPHRLRKNFQKVSTR